MGFGSIITIICIVGVLFYFLRPNKKTANDDWLEEAQRKQQNRFEYLNGHISKKKKPISYAKNMTFEEWIDEHKNDGFEGNPKEGIKWYPTGWIYNSKTGKWEPPNYLHDQSKEKWKWNEEKQIWIDKDKEARLEKYRKYHEGKPPTFEEWKAAKEKGNQDQSNNT